MRSLGRFAALVISALLLAAPAQADILELRDGRLIEGVVVAKGDTLHVISGYGVKELKRSDVKTHTKAPSLDDQIQQHVATLAPDDWANRALLARWLQEAGRAEEARALAAAVLEEAPENAVAHDVLGHVRHRGAWRTPDEAKRADGLEKHGDRWYTPEEWKHAPLAQRERAAKIELAALEQDRAKELGELIDLLVSPDPLIRERAKARLRELGKAEGVEQAMLEGALKAVDDYVGKLAEVRAKAAGVGGLGSIKPDGSGRILAELALDQSVLKRPIRVFNTSLASSFAPVSLMLPEVRLIRYRGTVSIPTLTPSK